jgi:hypothetical protein
MLDASYLANSLPAPEPHTQPVRVPRTIHIPARQNAPVLILGACTDGLPYMLDLDRAESGPVLITGQAGCGKTRLLQSMLASAVQMNPASDLQFVIVTPVLEQWEAFTRTRAMRPYSLGVYHPYEQDAGRLILDLADLTSLRRAGREAPSRRETILVVIDDLSPLCAQTFEVQSHLHALLENGPKARIWLLASLDISQSAGMTYWTAPFRTRILGYTQDREAASRLMLNPVVGCEMLRPGVQYQAWYGSDWTDIWAAPVDSHPAGWR